MERKQKRIVIVSLFLISVIATWKQPKPVQAIASHIVFPILYCIEHIVRPIKNISKTIRSYMYAHKKSISLAEENERLVDENVKLRATIDFLNRSKDVAEFKTRYSKNDLTLCKILLTNISSGGQFCIIDKGRHDNVTPNSAVIYKMHLIGKIEKVYQRHSRVRLVTDKICKVAAKISNASQSCIAEGNNKSDLITIRCISNIQKIKIGQRILSSGKGSIIPEGFSLGTISYISPPTLNQPGEWTITAKPSIDFKTIDYCRIITNPIQSLKEETNKKDRSHH